MINILNNTTWAQRVNYLLIFYYLAWLGGIQKIFSLLDAAGRIGMLLFVLSLCLTFRETNFRQLFKPKSIIFWGIWVIYVSVYWLYVGENVTQNTIHPLSSPVFIYSRFFIPFYIMMIAYLETIRDEEKLLQTVFVSFFAYVFSGIFFSMIHSVSYNNRIMSDLGNALPNTSVSLIFIVTLMNIKGLLSNKWVIFVILLAFAAILPAATRKAFIGASIIIAFAIIAKFHLNSSNKTPIVIIVSILAYIGMNAIIEATYLGERFKSGANDGAERNTSNIEWLNFLGDRVSFYINGFDLFQEQPLCGIGLSNYPLYPGNSLPIHSEYIVQLCECGLIGCILFILFYLYLFKNIINMPKPEVEEDYQKFLLLGYMIMMLQINLTTWTYQFPYYFICYGIILGVSALAITRNKESIYK